MKNKNITFLFVAIAVLVYLGIFLFSIKKIQDKPESLLITDVGRLYPTHVKEIVKENKVEDLQKIIGYAREKGIKISIAGSQHSQGGHTYYKDAVVLNMKNFNKILNIDLKNKILTVESGATWDDVQRYINPYNLSVKVMQSSNVFTIGGTLSANAHGRDLDTTALIKTVRGFRLLLANSTIINVSRSENYDLFKSVIGGYGMFGVILDVDLELTENEVYQTRTAYINYKDFPAYFEDNIKNNKNMGLMLVRPSIDPEHLFEEFAVLTWERTYNKSKDSKIFELGKEEHVARTKFIFGISRKYDWGKKLRWYLQKKYEAEAGRLITRNNAMRPPETPIEFLQYNSPSDTDILQEYFIPTRNFINFSEEFKKILQEDKVNVISFTIRYVVPNNESYLSYAPNEEAFAIIYYSNVKLSETGRNNAEKTVQKLADLAIKNNGTYYLTYNLYPTKKQIREAYPLIDEIFEKKKKYDPKELFMSKFYAKYALGEDEKSLEKIK